MSYIIVESPEVRLYYKAQFFCVFNPEKVNVTFPYHRIPLKLADKLMLHTFVPSYTLV